MEQLPNEILCTVFSLLDKKSRKIATATCQLWFDVIRNSNLSNHICFKGSVEELQGKIENLEWDWKRWPVLKKFEVQDSSGPGKRDLRNDLSIDFKQCPTLETVIFSANIDIYDLFHSVPGCPEDVATIDKLAFNPQCEITEFGVDHIWSLCIWEQNDEGFKVINNNIKGLKELWVDKFSYLDNLVCMDALLKLYINDDSSSELKIAGLKKLKTLTVRKLAQLDNLVGMDETLLELSVKSVTERELKEYDLSNIAKRFKNLQKCDIDVELLDGYIDDLIQPEKYAQIVQDVFQNSAIRVEIIFRKCSTTYLTKEPFQRCFMKKKVSKLAQLDDLVGMDTLLELHIDDDDSSSELKIAGLKKLKTLTVLKLAQLDNLVGMDETLLELSVQDVSERELKEYDLSNIAKRFKSLQKCEIYVDEDDEDLIQPEEYAQIVQDVFQNSATRVEICFNKLGSSTYLTKEPFQRCVIRKIVCKLAQLDDLVCMDETLLELRLEDVCEHELKEYDLSNIAKRFKNLQKLIIEDNYDDDLIQPEKYAQIVQDVFQNSATRVEIIFDKFSECPTYRQY